MLETRPVAEVLAQLDRDLERWGMSSITLATALLIGYVAYAAR